MIRNRTRTGEREIGSRSQLTGRTCSVRNAVPRSVGSRFPHTRTPGSDRLIDWVLLLLQHVLRAEGADIGEGVEGGVVSGGVVGGLGVGHVGKQGIFV